MWLELGLGVDYQVVCSHNPLTGGLPEGRIRRLGDQPLHEAVEPFSCVV